MPVKTTRKPRIRPNYVGRIEGTKLVVVAVYRDRKGHRQTKEASVNINGLLETLKEGLREQIYKENPR